MTILFGRHLLLTICRQKQIYNSSTHAMRANIFTRQTAISYHQWPREIMTITVILKKIFNGVSAIITA